MRSRRWPAGRSSFPPDEGRQTPRRRMPARPSLPARQPNFASIVLIYLRISYCEALGRPGLGLRPKNLRPVCGSYRPNQYMPAIAPDDDGHHLVTRSFSRSFVSISERVHFRSTHPASGLICSIGAPPRSPSSREGGNPRASIQTQSLVGAHLREHNARTHSSRAAALPTPHLRPRAKPAH